MAEKKPYGSFSKEERDFVEWCWEWARFVPEIAAVLPNKHPRSFAPKEMVLLVKSNHDKRGISKIQHEYMFSIFEKCGYGPDGIHTIEEYNKLKEEELKKQLEAQLKEREERIKQLENIKKLIDTRIDTIKKEERIIKDRLLKKKVETEREKTEYIQKEQGKIEKEVIETNKKEEANIINMALEVLKD